MNPVPQPHNFGPRSTDAEMDRRIGQAMDVLARKPTIRRSELRRIFREDPKTRWTDKNGNPVCVRTIAGIVSRARAEINARATIPKQDMAALILAGYERDLSDKDPKVRMAARLGIRQLRGLDEPNRVDVTTGGQQLPAPDVSLTQVNLSMDRINALLAAIPDETQSTART